MGRYPAKPAVYHSSCGPELTNVTRNTQKSNDLSQPLTCQMCMLTTITLLRTHKLYSIPNFDELCRYLTIEGVRRFKKE